MLAAYDYTCCVAGLGVPELLVASHTVPWSADPKRRMNPRNGLCLNALHDRAFDCRLMDVDEQLRIRFKDELKDRPRDPGFSWLVSFEGRRIRLPRKFTPDPQSLRVHAAG